jgi:membrane-associated phospholipid phosphatase
MVVAPCALGAFLALTAAFFFTPTRAIAQGQAATAAGPTADSTIYTREPVVSRRDLGILALGAGLSVIAQRNDQVVRDGIRAAGAQASGLRDGLAEIGNPWGAPIVLVGSAAMWWGGRFTGHPDVAATGLRAFETIFISGLITKQLKRSFGRARPRVSPTDAWNLEPWQGFGPEDGDLESMPSGHATAAFAFASAVTSEVRHRAPRHARWVGVTTYGLAATTAFARMHVDAHWLSDVTAGATIGIVTGIAVSRYHRTRPPGALDRLLLGADAMGRTRIGVQFEWQ